MDQKTAAKFRGLAQRYAAIAGKGAKGQDVDALATDMATEVLGALSDYKLAANFITFATGPLQRLFIHTYSDDIQADGERMLLRMYDDLATRKQAVAMAVSTGRLVFQEDGFWMLREARDTLELIQWATREGVAPAMDQSMALEYLEGQRERIAIQANAQPGELEEQSGHYL